MKLTVKKRWKTAKKMKIDLLKIVRKTVTTEWQPHWKPLKP
jgi:hypothetical protein